MPSCKGFLSFFLYKNCMYTGSNIYIYPLLGTAKISHYRYARTVRSTNIYLRTGRRTIPIRYGTSAAVWYRHRTVPYRKGKDPAKRGTARITASTSHVTTTALAPSLCIFRKFTIFDKDCSVARDKTQDHVSLSPKYTIPVYMHKY